MNNAFSKSIWDVKIEMVATIPREPCETAYLANFF